MSYNHFIITRFNLKFPDVTGGKNTSVIGVPANEWLANRTDLFMKYCLPSVLNQTSVNFKWLLYFDISNIIVPPIFLLIVSQKYFKKYLTNVLYFE